MPAWLAACLGIGVLILVPLLCFWFGAAKLEKRAQESEAVHPFPPAQMQEEGERFRCPVCGCVGEAAAVCEHGRG